MFRIKYSKLQKHISVALTHIVNYRIFFDEIKKEIVVTNASHSCFPNAFKKTPQMLNQN